MTRKKNKKEKKKIKPNQPDLLKEKCLLIMARYLILLGLMFTLPIIYKIFTPLTIYPAAFLLKAFFNNVLLVGRFIIINSKVIEISSACIAGSAYLLLLILNLSTSIRFKKRIYSIALSFLLLLTLNILRIFFLSILYLNNFSFFDITHDFFWYFLSTVFVIGIWFLIVKIFSIKEVPVYSDIKVLIATASKN